MRDGLVDGVDVVNQAAHQLPGRVAVEKAERQALQVLKQLAAHLLEGTLGDVGHDPIGGGLEEVGQQVGSQHQQGHGRQSGQLFGSDVTVDGHAHQVGTDQPQHCVEYDTEEDQAQCRLEGGEIGQ